MSTFLQLVQELHEQSGAAGVAPTSVVGQTGEAARLVRWIRNGDDYVKDLWKNWKFLRTTYQQNTVQSQATLPAPNDVSMWDLDTFFLTPNGFTEKEELQADEYEQIKREILDTTEGQPFRVIIMPDNSLMFESVPEAAHQINADYYTKPTFLAANTDVSDIPTQYHQVIIGRALMLYANFENAPEIKKQGEEIYAEFLNRLENDQLPNQNYSRYRTGGGFEVIAGQ